MTVNDPVHTRRPPGGLPPELRSQAHFIEGVAREHGLEFFDVHFELLDARDVNGVAAYGGFPVRYPSWRFGMEFERLEKGYQWGLSKIYELVINNDPTYAYLVRSNSLLEQKLVMAHVYGHADFFKNNVWFSPTLRNMVDVMGNHATRVRRYVDAFGQEVVEGFLDRVLSVETLIDPFLPLREMKRPCDISAEPLSPAERARRSLEALSASPLREDEPAPAPELEGPELPSFDVLGFLAENAPVEPWQRDVLRLVRREAYYFSPQRMTKVMNEGWASFWHSRLLTRKLLEPSEILDFADCHSGAMSSAPLKLNPYKLGIELFRHAEERGEDIFRLRRLHNDVSFIDALADEEFAERSTFFQPAGGAPGPDWHEAKQQLLSQLAWGGLPRIELVRYSAAEGELVLVHHHDGRDLQLGQARETLLNVGALWRGPVRLETLLEGEPRELLARDGQVELLGGE